MNRRRVLLQWAASCAALPAARAAQAVAVDDDAWHDRSRGRTLPLRMRWPDGDARCALIVHSHGLGGSRSGGDVWGQAWRQAGFAVLHLQYPGSDTEVFRAGMAAVRAAASAQQWHARAPGGLTEGDRWRRD